jgi:formylglycine-generating enzyme required for sulfatase activity
LLDHQAAIVTARTFRNDIAGLVRDIRAVPSGDTWRNIALGASALAVLGAGWLSVDRIADVWRAWTVRETPVELGQLEVEPGSGKSFRDRPRGGQPCSMCPELIVVPASTASGGFVIGTRGFVMGSESGKADERPVHQVMIAKPFAVAKYPVTRGEFAVFVKDSGYRADRGCAVFTGAGWKMDPERSWESPGFEQDDRHPVVCTNWADAKAFVAWLAQKTRMPYRLLSEAEWEYAARATKTTRFFFGDSPDEICRYANVADLTAKVQFPNWIVANCRDGYIYTAPVGSFKPNDWGLYDIIGNVRQRVEDCYNDSYRGAPSDGTAWTTGDCNHRVLRGGSWLNVPDELRSASRDSGAAKELRYDNYGFRVGRSMEP